jgi:hypothetical protein
MMEGKRNENEKKKNKQILLAKPVKAKVCVN